MSEDNGDIVECKFYMDMGVCVDRTVAGNFIVGIVIPDVDESGEPVERIFHTSITAAEMLVRGLNEAIEAAKGFDKEHNGAKQ